MLTADLLTILMPCRDQDPAFLRSALASVLAQSSPRWELLVIVHPDSPAAIAETVEALGDSRMSARPQPSGRLGAAVNQGMAAASSEFVCILLSDDELEPRAVEVMLASIRDHPEVDFFHSARRYIDEHGVVRTPVMPSRASFDPSYFRTIGSPVKHLLCWRRRAALAIGGLDDSLSAIGCDDYDLPWRMAEAGYRFRAVPEPLYRYRVHHRSVRLTTDVTIEEKVQGIARMFRGHGVPEPEIWTYAQHALDTYLVKDQTLAYDAAGERHDQGRAGVSCFTEAGEAARTAFLSQDLAARLFFPHRVYRLPKGGPDGLKLAGRMCGIDRPERLRQLVLYAQPPVLDEFPPELFFDDELQWHRQQFGRPGQVASANLVMDGRRLYGMVYLSDLVQRADRRPEHRTRLDNRFEGWPRLLFNAVMDFALDHGVREVYSPTAALAMRHTDPNRKVQPSLFERVYDRAVGSRLEVEQDGEWWRVDIERNRDRVVQLRKGVERSPRPEKTICLCHDIERGAGHRDIDPTFAAAVEGPARAALERMTALEQAAGLRATYNVLGSILPEIRSTIEGRHHACGFHSFDHRIPPAGLRGLASVIARWWSGGGGRGVDLDEMEECRRADYRLKGYRPPQSRLTPGLADRHLAWFNFEWLASSAWSFGFDLPRMENGIVKIPIHFDDFAMHHDGLSYPDWERRALAAIDARDFVAFSLHDCYAEHWLPHYEAFLGRIRERGTFLTLDEVAAQVTLAHARWVFDRGDG